MQHMRLKPLFFPRNVPSPLTRPPIISSSSPAPLLPRSCSFRCLQYGRRRTPLTLSRGLTRGHPLFQPPLSPRVAPLSHPCALQARHLTHRAIPSPFLWGVWGSTAFLVVVVGALAVAGFVMVEVRFTGFATLHWLEEIFRDRVGDPLFYWLDRQSRLPMIDDKVFEETDNLMVFFFDDQEHRIKMRAITNMLLKTLQRHDELKDVKPFYAYRTKKPKKETNSTTADSPASDSTPSAAAAAAASDAIPLGASVDDELPPMNVMMYKGQRRASLKVPFPPSGLTELPVPLEELLTFFKPRSQAADEVAHTAECPVRTITHDTFEVAVVAQATPTNPVLVQLYEDTCFLCFLMRPFVNSVAKILADNNVPLTIVRLNIERNDFPKDCPVARGTPTFVLFKEWKKPERWAEFKPKDFISRLEAAIGPDALTDTMRLQFTHLLDMLPVRLTLFSNLAFQLVDLNGLQAVSMGPQGEGGVGESSVKNMPPIAALQHTPPSAAAAPPAGRSDTGEGSKANGGSSEEFQRVVTELMEADMNRVDCLAENVELLKREADQAESDVLYYAILMAEKLVEWERKARSE